MTYSDYGLSNTRAMFADAILNKYAIGAFNFYNMETLRAILNAADIMHSPVILAVSESALKYMNGNVLMGMILGLKLHGRGIALHLDHGKSFESCARAIELGFSSVMIDASELPLGQNIELTRRVVDLAKKYNVSTEAELGTLSGFEDENTKSDKTIYTNPGDVLKFVMETDVDSLAIAIGTSHGAYKRKSAGEELRFDILDEIARLLPDFPLVLHGASSIPENLVDTINKFGGKIDGARGIPADQLKTAVSKNICKINVDSDARLAFTAGVRTTLWENPENFDPRKFLTSAMDLMTKTYTDSLETIMLSKNRAL